MTTDNTADPRRGAALRSFGRRRGKPLSATRAGLLETRLPGLEVDVAAPAAFVGKGRELWLEIGFGAAEHLLAQARAHPEVAFIGCEPFINGVAKLVAAIAHDHLDNIRIWPDDARPVLAALPTGSVKRCFVLFPDPWPKARHAKRRLIQPALLDLLARVLADGAELRIASDHPGYVQWALAHLLRHPAFAWPVRGPADWRHPPPGWVQTRYEQKALAGGVRPAYLRFYRRPRA